MQMYSRSRWRKDNMNLNRVNSVNFLHTGDHLFERCVQHNEDFSPVLIGTVHTSHRDKQKTVNFEYFIRSLLGRPDHWSPNHENQRIFAHKTHRITRSAPGVLPSPSMYYLLCPRQSRGWLLAVSLVWPHHRTSWDAYILLGNFFGAFILCMHQLWECIPKHLTRNKAPLAITFW